MLYNVRLVSSALCGYVFFFNFIPNALSETNQIWIVSSIHIDGASDAENFGSVCLVVREKI